MRVPVRIALVVVGLAAVIFGWANMTGGWLGVPRFQPVVYLEDGPYPPRKVYPEEGLAHQTARQLGGVAVMTLGFIVAAVGAWPRRRRAIVTPESSVEFRKSLAFVGYVWCGLLILVLVVLIAMVSQLAYGHD